jgi:hypothetical protein
VQAKRRHHPQPSGTRSTKGQVWVIISGTSSATAKLAVSSVGNARRRHWYPPTVQSTNALDGPCEAEFVSVRIENVKIPLAP